MERLIVAGEEAGSRDLAPWLIGVAPASERSFDSPRVSETRQEIRCCACGYGAVATRPPSRCPMCGSGDWSPVCSESLIDDEEVWRW
ncbi:MAG: hypothetical protein ACXVZP_10620 [Gaiellaceae bacterium]